jgi:hypothetical protein
MFSYDYVGDGDATGDENVNDDVMNVLVCAFSHVHEFNFEEFILATITHPFNPHVGGVK